MPRSPGKVISRVLNICREIGPQSVLDVGCGWGEYGFLLRFHMERPELWPKDITESPDWEMRIDGIEIVAENIGGLHKLCYNRVSVGNVFDLLDDLPEYDVILMGELVEHLEKADAERLIRGLLPKAKKACIITTPLGFMPHGALLGQETERHLSGWMPKDFKQLGECSIFLEGLEQKWPGIVCALTNDPSSIALTMRSASRLRAFIRHMILDILGPNLGASALVALRKLNARLHRTQK